MSLFCTHKWIVLSTTTTESKFQHACNIIGPATGNIKIPAQMSQASRKYIQIIVCENCGKLKRFVEDI